MTEDEKMRFECLKMAKGDLDKAQELVSFVEGLVSLCPSTGAVSWAKRATIFHHVGPSAPSPKS